MNAYASALLRDVKSGRAELLRNKTGVVAAAFLCPFSKTEVHKRAKKIGVSIRDAVQLGILMIAQQESRAVALDTTDRTD